VVSPAREACGPSCLHGGSVVSPVSKEGYGLFYGGRGM
jgi:hypothetical protein